MHYISFKVDIKAQRSTLKVILKLMVDAKDSEIASVRILRYASGIYIPRFVVFWCHP